MVDTELGGILLEQIVDVDHAILVFLCFLSLGQASKILNLLAFCLIIGNLAFKSALYFIFADIGELMSWQQPWQKFHIKGQISVHQVLKTLRLLSSKHINVLFNNTEENSDS